MSLLVWLPLLGNLNNQGTANVTVTNNGASVDNNGKLGKCYSFNGSSNYINISNLPNPANLTVSFWMLRSANTGTRQFMFTAWTGVTCELTTDNKIVCTCYGNGANQGSCTYTDQAITTSSGWVHVTYTFEDKVGGKLYVNGNLVKSSSSSQSIAWGTTSGKIGYFSTYFNGKINDFRFYDEVLSAKQIREIAKGLVAHYPLDDIYGTDNLIVNGFGEGGTENWMNSNYSTSEKPSSPTTIKASYYNNETLEYTPIITNHSYTLSMYLKAKTTSGTGYPSIITFDIDKKEIRNHHCADGFISSTKTTLKQPLKKGDTVIYANSLSSWDTGTSNYRDRVAIFGYKDSTGYVYPDMIYTQDSPLFGSYSDKSNINKTNNTITLLSAYTGEDRPAGTTICQAADGSRYFYPWNGVSYSAVPDWTLKTYTFIPDNISRMKPMKYLKWRCHESVLYHAGIKLIDNTDNSIIRDISGYASNGTAGGNLTLSTESIRHKHSTSFDGSSSYAAIGRNGMVKDEITVNVWAYMSNWSSYAGRLASCTEGGGWNFEPSGGYMYFQFGAGASSNSYVGVKSSVALSSLSGWVMFTGTWDGKASKIYINGELKGTNNVYSSKTPAYYNASNGIFIGAEAGSTTTTPAGSYFNGKLSDFRIYATALSANDVKELYQTSASIDNQGNLFTNEISEV